MTPIAHAIARRLKRAAIERRLEYDDIARRAGLHPRTVERLLEGECFRAETADAVAQALRIELDDSTEERLTRGLPLWRLPGSPTPWARLVDAAEHAGYVNEDARKRFMRGVRLGHVDDDEIRTGVRDQDVTPVRCRSSALTTSPNGVAMVTARAALWLLLTADTRQGEVAVGVMVADGLERLRRSGRW